MDYTRQTPYSDPRHHLAQLTALPDDVAGIAAVVRNLVVHYRASGLPFSPARLAEIDSRWVDRMLDADASRFALPLDAPRPVEQRIVGCCRDFTLLTVAAMRAKGIPARSRVGFADYLEDNFHVDHVVAEYHDGRRWIALDAQLDPVVDFPAVDLPAAGLPAGLPAAGLPAGLPAAGLPAAVELPAAELPPADFQAVDFPVDVLDLPLGPGGLRTAAQSWVACRRGDANPDTFGVGVGSPVRGLRMVGQYVLLELAHRRGDELLLWDAWGYVAGVADQLAARPLAQAWSDPPPWRPDELTLVDELADLLLAADAGDKSAEDKLARRYAEDHGLRPADTVICHSPRGVRSEANLRRRTATMP